MTAFKHSILRLTRMGALAPSIVMSAILFAGVSAAAQETTIVAFGDSLTAGYGVNAGESFPVQLEAALRKKGYDVEIRNAGVSGDTTAAGLARFDWAVGEDADAVIVALGANDALRGLAPGETRKNLEAIVQKIEARNVPVLVAGMLAPRNLGAEYAAEYDALFKEVAEDHDALFYPFFLEGVATDPDLNQGDGMHPNLEGVKVIVSNILPFVEDLMSRARD